MSLDERLDELLKDVPSEEEMMALLPPQEELTATINRLLAAIGSDS